MSVTEFFDRYVYGQMCKDIERELDLVRAGVSAGSFLCAMGLLAYTEYMGTLAPEAGRTATANNRFNAFFGRMGPEYRALLSRNIYDTFRCGFVHQYFAKDWCSIYMLNEGEPMVVRGEPPRSGLTHPWESAARVSRPVATGIGMAENGGWYFVVEKYLEDFNAACGTLQRELEASWGGQLAAQWIRPTTKST